MPLWLRKSDEARHISGMFLNGALERPFHEAVKVEAGLPKRPQEVGDVKSHGIPAEESC